MSTIGWVHLTFAVLALIAGTAVVSLRKGDRYHRTLGHIYFTSLVAVNVTSLTMYRLTGSFNFFHWSALASLGFLLGGIVAVVRRRPRGEWLARHAFFVTGSYVGLLAAAVAETATRWLALDFGLTVAAATLAVTAVGIALMLRQIPPVLKQMGRGQR